MPSMTIDGQLARGKAAYDVRNPATGSVFDSVPECSSAQLDAAVGAASRAFSTWQKNDAPRREALLKAAEIVSAEAEQLGKLVTLEQGKPLAKAVREVRGAASWLRYVAGLEISSEVVHDQDGLHVEVGRRALGVVAAITPWNFPVIVAAGKIAAALRAGNTVVLKPSPFTPIATLRLGELLQAVLPPGVLNVLSGGDEIGRALVRHPLIRKVSFTGSTEAGKHIFASAAPDLKRVTLELGGNDAAIVLDDVDPAAIANAVFWGAFANSGQVCSAIKRLYVHERVYEPLVQALSEIANNVHVGEGLDPSSEMGPVSTEPQFERVLGLFEDATRRGGRVRAGGKRIGDRGYFFSPTLVEGLSEDARLVQEEQFGPVLPVMRFSREAEAFERANATQFGLSGSIWSADRERARALAAELDCGTVWINQHLSVVPAAPVAGHKWSGVGAENGQAGLLEFTQIQVTTSSREN